MPLNDVPVNEKSRDFLVSALCFSTDTNIAAVQSRPIRYAKQNRPMTIHSPAFTNNDYTVLLEALLIWEELGKSESASDRKAKVALLKAKIALQLYDTSIDRSFDQALLHR